MLTRSQFLLAFSGFSKVSSALIDAKLAIAAKSIGPAFGGVAGIENEAHGQLTAHLLALEPIGKDMRLQSDDGSTVFEVQWIRYQRMAASGPWGP